MFNSHTVVYTEDLADVTLAAEKKENKLVWGDDMYVDYQIKDGKLCIMEIYQGFLPHPVKMLGGCKWKGLCDGDQRLMMAGAKRLGYKKFNWGNETITMKSVETVKTERKYLLLGAAIATACAVTIIATRNS